MADKMSKFQFARPMLTKLEYGPGTGDPSHRPIQIDLHFLRAMQQLSENSAVVELTLQINKTEDTVHKDAVYWMEVRYGAVFNWEEGCCEDEVNRFLRINAPALLLAYIRTTVAQVTAESPYGVYHVPFLDMTQVFKEDTVQ